MFCHHKPYFLHALNGQQPVDENQVIHHDQFFIYLHHLLRNLCVVRFTLSGTFLVFPFWGCGVGSKGIVIDFNLFRVHGYFLKIFPCTIFLISLEDELPIMTWYFWKV